MSEASFSPTSRRDLHAIFDRIAKDNPGAAVDLVRKIEKKCKRLAQDSDMGEAGNNLPIELRASAVGRYVILYRAVHNGIDIVRIVHGATDIGALFD